MYEGDYPLILYTPGHSLYTDTLILYGLIYALNRKFGEKLDEPGMLRVIGTGSGYLIETQFSLGDIAGALTDVVNYEREDIQRELRRGGAIETYADGRVGLLEENDISYFTDSLLNSDVNEDYLRSLTSPYHASAEGRTAKGRQFVKVKLPLMPMAGKYFTSDLTKEGKFRVKEYRICNQCAGLATLGLYAGAFVGRWGTTRTVITIAFEGEVIARTLAFMLSLVRSEADLLKSIPRDREIRKELKGGELSSFPLSIEIGRSSDNIPLRTLTYATLSCFSDTLLRGLAETDASWKSISVKFDIGKATQVRGYEEVSLNPLIDSLYLLLQSTTAFRRLHNTIRRLLGIARRKGAEANDAVSALDYLFLFFETRRALDLYSFTRYFEVTMDRWAKATKRPKPSLTRDLCFNLVTLVTKP